MAVMDVPTRWLVMAGVDANANWQAHPLDAADGYGQTRLHHGTPARAIN